MPLLFVFQPFTAPTIVPFIRYLCRKGYIARIGKIEITIVAFLRLWVGIPVETPSPNCPARSLASEIMFLITYCIVYRLECSESIYSKQGIHIFHAPTKP